MDINVFMGTIFILSTGWYLYLVLFLKSKVDRLTKNYDTIKEKDIKQLLKSIENESQELGDKIKNLHTRIVEVENSLISFKAKINKKKIEKK